MRKRIIRTAAVAGIALGALLGPGAAAQAAGGDPSQWSAPGDPSQWSVTGDPSQWG
ncbi:hypothetical protein Skr01_65670 [Sphaerisporangium krabiense]|uniref:Uncharacterized protein n=1 Tax=Sphaerisporangium krabiense TaxID=763782 RepID=A0A7W9DN01_9ACTN|nr:hypothetical protein [Sphaerisporangium krabiense]MBB5624818.1 hypothetical protein [Sphaerisporangium krabiense]GII66482.1 hypothetical protein Skr01_65670 [Sphaerisporangium krabiense]